MYIQAKKLANQVSDEREELKSLTKEVWNVFFNLLLIRDKISEKNVLCVEKSTAITK